MIFISEKWTDWAENADVLSSMRWDEQRCEKLKNWDWSIDIVSKKSETETEIETERWMYNFTE